MEHFSRMCKSKTDCCIILMNDRVLCRSAGHGWMWPVIRNSTELIMKQSDSRMLPLWNVLGRLQTPNSRWCLGPTVFRGKFCQIPQASLQNSTAHHGKIVQILQLTAAFHLCVN